MPQWICLCLPSCHSGFESQARHLLFYHFNQIYVIVLCLSIVKITKNKQKEARFGPFFKISIKKTIYL